MKKSKSPIDNQSKTAMENFTKKITLMHILNFTIRAQKLQLAI